MKNNESRKLSSELTMIGDELNRALSTYQMIRFPQLKKIVGYSIVKLCAEILARVDDYPNWRSLLLRHSKCGEQNINLSELVVLSVMCNKSPLTILEKQK